MRSSSPRKRTSRLASVLDGEESQRAANRALELASERHRREPGSVPAQELLASVHFRFALNAGYPGSLPHWQEAQAAVRVDPRGRPRGAGASCATSRWSKSTSAATTNERTIRSRRSRIMREPTSSTRAASGRSRTRARPRSTSPSTSATWRTCTRSAASWPRRSSCYRQSLGHARAHLGKRPGRCLRPRPSRVRARPARPAQHEDGTARSGERARAHRVRLNQGLVDLSLSYRAQQARAYLTLGRIETARGTPGAACATFCDRGRALCRPIGRPQRRGRQSGEGRRSRPAGGVPSVKV